MTTDDKSGGFRDYYGRGYVGYRGPRWVAPGVGFSLGIPGLGFGLGINDPYGGWGYGWNVFNHPEFGYGYWDPNNLWVGAPSGFIYDNWNTHWRGRGWSGSGWAHKGHHSGPHFGSVRQGGPHVVSASPAQGPVRHTAPAQGVPAAPAHFGHTRPTHGGPASSTGHTRPTQGGPASSTGHTRPGSVMPVQQRGSDRGSDRGSSHRGKQGGDDGDVGGDAGDAADSGGQLQFGFGFGAPYAGWGHRRYVHQHPSYGYGYADGEGWVRAPGDFDYGRWNKHWSRHGWTGRDWHGGSGNDADYGGAAATLEKKPLSSGIEWSGALVFICVLLFLLFVFLIAAIIVGFCRRRGHKCHGKNKHSSHKKKSHDDSDDDAEPAEYATVTQSDVFPRTTSL